MPVYLKQMGIEKILNKENIEMVRHTINCTECRECEQRCPFNVEIVEGLKRNRDMVEGLIREQGLETI